ncbi:MAG: HigA family addiction module antidote protein [Treponema sp.]|jgi:addiction module HigA family antidote|nr:HigA family addiction module antidote protein [Treponema sp.]
MQKTASSQIPGTVLKDFLDEYQLNPTQLAAALKLSQSAVRQITINKTRISVPVALRLSKFFGNSCDFWLDLQKNYDLAAAAKDGKLNAALKSIQKVKKPAAKKEEKTKVAKKAKAPSAKAPKAPAAKAPAKAGRKARKASPQNPL